MEITPTKKQNKNKKNRKANKIHAREKSHKSKFMNSYNFLIL